MEWRYIIIFSLIAYGNFIHLTYANSSATPEVETIEFPQIIINEVSFKDSKQDWIELYTINDHNKGFGSSVKGLQIQDDSVFFTVKEDIKVKTGEYLILYFKESEEKIFRENDLLTINITKSGLTGTTEQVVIKNHKNEILDAVCWKNDSPTQSETEDFEEIKTEIRNCINSEEVNTNNSIGRTNFIDTNTKNDWRILSATSPGTNSSIVEEEPEPEETNVENPENHEIPKCFSDIFINEIFPNPIGKDTGIEWIELFNSGDTLCQLKGLIIDDREGGSKPYTLKEHHLINNNGFLLLPSWETKINLNNSEDSVRLLFPDETVQDEISYENALENKSYSKNTEEEFVWTQVYTPLFPNLISIEDPEEKKIASEKESSKSKKEAPQIRQIQNGTLSNKIYITEILPNPKGTDKGNEWIEIFNDSEKSVKLGNWYIDTGKESAKKYTFNNRSIEASEYLTVSDKELGFSLKNSEGIVRLVDFKDTVIDEVEYKSGLDDESFMKITVFEEDNENREWKWTKNITPGEKNPSLYKYKGQILKFDEIMSKLSINSNGKIFDINVIEDGDILLAQLFTEGSIISVTVSKDEKENLILEEYEIIKSSEKKQDESQGLIYIILSSLPSIGLFGYLGIKKLGLLKIISS